MIDKKLYAEWIEAKDKLSEIKATEKRLRAMIASTLLTPVLGPETTQVSCAVDNNTIITAKQPLRLKIDKEELSRKWAEL